MHGCQVVTALGHTHTHSMGNKSFGDAARDDPPPAASKPVKKRRRDGPTAPPERGQYLGQVGSQHVYFVPDESVGVPDASWYSLPEEENDPPVASVLGSPDPLGVPEPSWYSLSDEEGEDARGSRSPPPPPRRQVAGDGSVTVLGRGAEGCVVAPVWDCATRTFVASDTATVSKLMQVEDKGMHARVVAAVGVLGHRPDMFVLPDMSRSCGMPRMPTPACVTGGKGKHFFNHVMTRLEGESLLQWMDRGAGASPRELLAGAVRILSLVAHIHARGYIHGDAFARNLYLQRGHRLADLLLMDFGFFEKFPGPGTTILRNADYGHLGTATSGMVTAILSATYKSATSLNFKLLGMVNLWAWTKQLRGQLHGGDAAVMDALLTIVPERLSLDAQSHWKATFPVASAHPNWAVDMRKHLHDEASGLAATRQHAAAASEVGVVASTCLELVLRGWAALVSSGHRLASQDVGLLADAVAILKQGVSMLVGFRPPAHQLQTALEDVLARHR